MTEVLHHECGCCFHQLGFQSQQTETCQSVGAEPQKGKLGVILHHHMTKVSSAKSKKPQLLSVREVKKKNSFSVCDQEFVSLTCIMGIYCCKSLKGVLLFLVPNL